MSDATAVSDDSDLLARLRAGEDQAYEALVRLYGGRMLAAAHRILGSDDDAAEVVQEAFLSAFKAIDRFQGDSKIGTWLHRIAINAALMRLRKRKRREANIEDLLPAYTENGGFAAMPDPWSEEVDARLLREEARDQVRARIDELPENYRVALLLRDIEGYSNEELAEALDVTVNAAKIRVHRARQALRTLLDSYVNGGVDA
ncbi:MAG TPA: sigma-70 family RNA polymerase sigma factor [Planctomycetota bacterium]|nr:sigma-70 family RNA polymerase sigma factor [Planctomycetota bacterium]